MDPMWHVAADHVIIDSTWSNSDTLYDLLFDSLATVLYHHFYS